MTNTSLAKLAKWSECPQLGELALIIDAVPIALRVPLLQSAVAFEPASDFEAGYIVGEIRSRLVDSLVQLFGRFATTKCTAMALLPGVDVAICRFASCGDPAEVQLAVCDLLECIALAVSTNEGAYRCR